MSAKAEIKHSVALFAVATGGLSLIVAAVCGWYAFSSGAGGWYGCTAVAGLVGLWQIRRGVRMRHQAIAEGASTLEEASGLGHTTKTGTRKPSFTDRKKKPGE